MKTMEEVERLLAQRVASDPVTRLLNETFGHFGWEVESFQFGDHQRRVELKVMVRVGESQAVTVKREGASLAEVAATFGLEVKNGPDNAPGKEIIMPPETRTEPPVQAPVQSGPSRKVIEESISATSQIILAKKLKTQEELVAMLQGYGVRTKAQLSDEQAMELLNKLKELVK